MACYVASKEPCVSLALGAKDFLMGTFFFLVIVPWFDPGNYHSPLPLVGAFDRAVDKEAALLQSIDGKVTQVFNQVLIHWDLDLRQQDKVQECWKLIYPHSYILEVTLVTATECLLLQHSGTLPAPIHCTMWYFAFLSVLCYSQSPTKMYYYFFLCTSHSHIPLLSSHIIYSIQSLYGVGTCSHFLLR